jgi:hypothetical protein
MFQFHLTFHYILQAYAHLLFTFILFRFISVSPKSTSISIYRATQNNEKTQSVHKIYLFINKKKCIFEFRHQRWFLYDIPMRLSHKISKNFSRKFRTQRDSYVWYTEHQTYCLSVGVAETEHQTYCLSVGVAETGETGETLVTTTNALF